MLTQLCKHFFNKNNMNSTLEVKNTIMLLSFVILAVSTGDEDAAKEFAKIAEDSATQAKPEYITGEWLATAVALCWFIGALTSMIFKK